MSNKNYNFGFKHYLRYFLENQIISAKTKLEFETHFLSDIFYSIFSTIIIIFFFLIFEKNFKENIDISFEEMLVIFFTIKMINVVSCIFSQNKQLGQKYIKTGLLNTLFLKPGNRFLNYIFFHTKASQLFYFFPYFIVFFICFLYFEINLSFLYNLNFLFLFFTLIIFLISLKIFFISLSWIFLDFGDRFHRSFEDGNDFFYKFPTNIFDSKNIKFLFFIFPYFLSWIYILKILRGNTIFDFYYLFIIIFFICILLWVLTHLTWKYGLRKYEAFG